MSARGRYSNKWLSAEQDTLIEMQFDEESLCNDGEFHNAFQEVDLKTVTRDDYELLVEWINLRIYNGYAIAMQYYNNYTVVH